MTGEADRCTLIRVGRLINSIQAAQNRNLPHTYTAYTTTQQVGRLGFTVCRLAPSAPLPWPQEIMGGRGLGAMEHTRGRPAAILCNAPMGNESPIHRQCDQLHTEGENEVWQVKQEPEPEGRNKCEALQAIVRALCTANVTIRVDCSTASSGVRRERQ